MQVQLAALELQDFQDPTVDKATQEQAVGQELLVKWVQ